MRRSASILLLSLALAAGVASAQSYSTVEERMTGSEFKAAGLDKLSPEELAALNAWLQQQNSRAVAAGAVGPAGSGYRDRNGFDDAPERREIVSRLVGDFKGWDGGTTFTLENGQVWQQIGPELLAGVGVMNSPRVFIKPGFVSGWKLQVEGYNSTVKVKRIK